MTDIRIAYVTRLADNVLVLAQRMVERVAADPELEEELANANFALDYIGQARMLYSYAAELEGQGRDEDDFAFCRDEREFKNLLLLEQPNGHFGDAIVRLFLFDAFHLRILEALQNCSDEGLVQIAARGVKEVTYHLKHSTKWLVRLGDGTALSHERVQESLNQAWRFTGEMFAEDALDAAFQSEFKGPDLAQIRELWSRDVDAVLRQAILERPADTHMASGGKDGRHSEHFGYMLADMQYLQRSFPGATW